jgi:DNA mismatch repair protein MutS
MGDFYELFAEDAVSAAPLLGVTLTSRDKRSPNPMPMAGIPFHSATSYIQKLLNAGKKVAIAEQILPEGVSADQIKGIVDRQIIRTFSPAVQFEMGTGLRARFLGTLNPSSNKTHVLAMLEPATGEIRISSELTLSDLLAEPALQEIRHFLNAGSKTPIEFLNTLENEQDVLIEEISSNTISNDAALPFLQKQFQKLALHPLLELPAARLGAAQLIQYVTKSQGLETLTHLHEPKPLTESNRMVTGPHTHTHLDTEDLFALINQTATSMGSRALKGELFAPLKNTQEIALRQASVRELAQSSLASLKIHEELKSVYDLDRILGRVATRLAHPRDTYALGASLSASFRFETELSRFHSPELNEIANQFRQARKSLQPLADRILRTQKADAPMHTREAGIFEKGTDPELDRLIELTTDGERFLVELEQRERESTGIASLKVKYNRVFGYFIEISSSNLKNVPEHYQRKQTMVGGERFFTEELKKFEEEILSASSKQRALEAKLFETLLQDLISESQAMKALSTAIGKLDSLIALSLLATRPGWCIPTIDDSLDLFLKGSRHPVVDAALKGEFIPNDIELSEETARTLIITGPNMGGKSTLMRQIALTILLGQMGAPVPAREARFGVFHSLFTRIGAQDAIAKGQSTFMVEMVELAHILTHSNDRSFIVLDEIGRGTSTFDGMSVAHASLEHLHQKARARMVFATHYHELTELEAKLPGIRNAYMKVLDQKGKLTFLYEIAIGRSSKSFGIQVAELAGIPKPVVKKAWEILRHLEENQSANSLSHTSQLSLFASAPAESQTESPPPESIEPAFPNELESELLALEVDHLRPIDALQILSRMQSDLKSRQSNEGRNN